MRPWTFAVAALTLAALLTWSPDRVAAQETSSAGDGVIPRADQAVAYFAAGCFWCVEADFDKLPGVLDVRSGFMGGSVADPSYEAVVRGGTGHREVVEVLFDPTTIDYQALLDAFWRMHDPSDAGGSFVDRGFTYTSAIFVVDEGQLQQATAALNALDAAGILPGPVATVILPAGPFWLADAYHQDFALTSPVRYQYYRVGSGRDAFIARTWTGVTTRFGADPDVRPAWWREIPSDDVLRATLDPLTYRVVRENGTERAFTHPYDKFYEPGIYVDVLSGEPLFSSRDKFDSGTGWPSFTRPIDPQFVVTLPDRSLWVVRTEVRSRHGDAHLGHVFDDGPAPTGERWCINGVALRFVPLAEMEAQGYGAYVAQVQGD